MNTHRKTAAIVGGLFIIGTAAGILSGVFTSPFLTNPDYLVTISENENKWILGTLLVLVMGLPLAMVPVVLYPIFRKRNEVLALGAVLFRGVLEAVSYMALVVSMLLLLTASQGYVKTGATGAFSYQALGVILVKAGDWIGLILAIVFSIGTLMINCVFYQMKLIPRWLSGWGLIGSVLYFAAPFISMCGSQHLALSLDSQLGFLLGPLAVQEMVLAVWLIVKGFSQPAITSNPV
jgi:hypothetical protein